MKQLYLLLFCLIAITVFAQIAPPPLPPAPPPPPPMTGMSAEESEAYEKLQTETSFAFYSYTNAVKRNDEEHAAWCLSRKSWKYYKELQQHILYSRPKELESVNLFTQKAILKARLCFDADSLISWDSLDFFNQMTNYGYLGDDWEMLEGVRPARVKSFGDSAQARIIYKTSLTQKSYSPKYVNYYKEYGSWRVDISAIIVIAAEDFRRKFEIKWGHSPQKYIIDQLEEESKGQISQRIWDPLVK